MLISMSATQHETQDVYEALNLHAFNKAAANGSIDIYERDYGEANGRFRCRIYVQVNKAFAPDNYQFNFGVVTHAVDSVTKDFFCDLVFETAMTADAKAFIAHLKFIDRLLNFSRS